MVHTGLIADSDGSGLLSTWTGISAGGAYASIEIDAAVIGGIQAGMSVNWK